MLPTYRFRKYTLPRLNIIDDRREGKRKGDSVPQVKVLARIKSFATLSLGRMEHSNFSGFL